METKMREEFEAHMRSRGFDSYELCWDKNFGYHSVMVDDAWLTWQAAYAAGQQSLRTELATERAAREYAEAQHAHKHAELEEARAVALREALRTTNAYDEAERLRAELERVRNAAKDMLLGVSIHNNRRQCCRIEGSVVDALQAALSDGGQING